MCCKCQPASHAPDGPPRRPPPGPKVCTGAVGPEQPEVEVKAKASGESASGGGRVPGRPWRRLSTQSPPPPAPPSPGKMKLMATPPGCPHVRSDAVSVSGSRETVMPFTPCFLEPACRCPKHHLRCEPRDRRAPLFLSVPIHTMGTRIAPTSETNRLNLCKVLSTDQRRATEAMVTRQ